MKFLICGLGSIGQRHVRLLRSELGANAEIYCLRARGNPLVIHDDLTVEKGVDPAAHYGLKGTFSELGAALAAQRFDAVFVTNPSHLHLETSLKAAEAGCHLFIEKPLAHTDEGLGELSDLAARKRLVVQVGYQMAFHPAYATIADILAGRMLGPLTHAEFHFGEWLPGVHEYEDYRQTYIARAEQGGGAIRCLSHKIHIARQLMGELRLVSAEGGRLSELEMDAEDTAVIAASSPLCPAVAISLDLVENPPRVFDTIAGEAGSLHFDFLANKMRLQYPGNKVSETAPFNVVRNDLFAAQLRNFLAAVAGKEKPRVTLADGIAVSAFCARALEKIKR